MGTGMPTAETRPSVLLVDDVEANLIALEAQLSKLDCRLVRARSGNEALRLLLKESFAVLLLDVQMPEMDGYEVALYARENPDPREVPIIFVTASHETEENALRGYGAGAVDFLFKPINPEILRSKVQVFLELEQGRRRLAAEVAAHRETMAELEAFNYSVSHDLRAPLRPLEGFSQALMEDYGDRLDEKAHGYLERIRSASQRMGQLIDDLLRLSRLGRGFIRAAPVDLAALATSIVQELRAAEPGRTVTFTCPPQLPAEGDAQLLKIALENLLRNAWKFSAKVADARLELGVREEDGERSFFVRDNGVGFDLAFAGRLFQPFQRFHTTAEFEGTGIGLAIVQRIVHRHGGRIWATSELDCGASFKFTLS